MFQSEWFCVFSSFVEWQIVKRCDCISDGIRNRTEFPIRIILNWVTIGQYFLVLHISALWYFYSPAKKKKKTALLVTRVRYVLHAGGPPVDQHYTSSNYCIIDQPGPTWNSSCIFHQEGKAFEGSRADDYYCMEHTHMNKIHNIFLIQNLDAEAKAVVLQASFRLDLTQQHLWVICLWFSCAFLALTLQGHLGNPIRWGLKDPPVLLGGDSLYFSEASVDWNHWCQSSFWPRWVISPNFVIAAIILPLICPLSSLSLVPWKQEIRKDTFHPSQRVSVLVLLREQKQNLLTEEHQTMDEVCKVLSL